MSDTTTTESTPEGTKTQEVSTPLEPAGKVYDEAYVKELRQEAAAARVAKKDAVDAAVAALKAEHAQALADKDVAYTELQNELGAAWIELQKVYTSLDAKVPSEKVRQFTAILQGTDEESIGASAKANLELIGGFDTKPTAPNFFDPTQGRGGKDPIPLNGDPILNAMKSVLKIT